VICSILLNSTAVLCLDRRLRISINLILSDISIQSGVIVLSVCLILTGEWWVYRFLIDMISILINIHVSSDE
jgi:hypothetical protein